MLLLGEQDVDDLVAGERIHTDDQPILEFSDMEQYGMIDVEPNLKRLLGYQAEDRGQYFTGSDRERMLLKRHFAEYRRDYSRQIRRYESAAGPAAD